MSKEPSKTYDFGAELDDVDISQLVSTTPTNEGDKAPPAEQVRQVAEKAGYTSREAKSLKSKKIQSEKDGSTAQAAMNSLTIVSVPQ